MRLWAAVGLLGAVACGNEPIATYGGDDETAGEATSGSGGEPASQGGAGGAPEGGSGGKATGGGSGSQGGSKSEGGAAGQPGGRAGAAGLVGGGTGGAGSGGRSGAAGGGAAGAGASAGMGGGATGAGGSTGGAGDAGAAGRSGGSGGSGGAAQMGLLSCGKATSGTMCEGDRYVWRCDDGHTPTGPFQSPVGNHASVDCAPYVTSLEWCCFAGIVLDTRPNLACPPNQRPFHSNSQAVGSYTCIGAL